MRFSIVTPVHNPPAGVLEAMLASVAAQSDPDWEHCIVDDGSTAPHVRSVLDAAAAADPRIKVMYRADAGGIVAASNEAIAAASGEYLALLDHDDLLHPLALERVANAIAAAPDSDYIYTDEDKVTETGEHYDVFLKPDWSPDRMRAQMYTCHLSVLRRELVERVGGFRDGFDGSQDWDLVLRVTELARRVTHVREVCYHWRAVPASAAAAVDAKPYAAIAAQRAVNEHIERTGFQGHVDAPATDGVQRLVPRLDSTPKVSIVIPTAGGAKELRGVTTTLVTRCVESVVERSTYSNYEIIVVADTSTSAPVRAHLEAVGGDRLRIVDYPFPFNFSEKINLGTLHGSGEYVLLLNDDIEVLPDGWRSQWPRISGSSSWIESMLMYAMQPGVGAVGARLFFNDLRIQHTGVVLHGGLPSHPYRGFPSQYPGYFSNANAVCNYVAVTAACLMVSRAAFEAVGGFSTKFPVNYNDVDFCLKLHAHGYRNVYNPGAELVHYESATREAHVSPAEIARLQERWRSILADDPYYHPYFFQQNPDFHPSPMLTDGTLLVTR